MRFSILSCSRRVVRLWISSREHSSELPRVRHVDAAAGAGDVLGKLPDDLLHRKQLVGKWTQSFAHCAFVLLGPIRSFRWPADRSPDLSKSCPQNIFVRLRSNQCRTCREQNHYPAVVLLADLYRGLHDRYQFRNRLVVVHRGLRYVDEIATGSISEFLGFARARRCVSFPWHGHRRAAPMSQGSPSTASA